MTPSLQIVRMPDETLTEPREGLPGHYRYTTILSLNGVELSRWEVIGQRLSTEASPALDPPVGLVMLAEALMRALGVGLTTRDLRVGRAVVAQMPGVRMRAFEPRGGV